MKYYIKDKTSNTGRDYIDHNCENCSLRENAIVFNSAQEAIEFILGSFNDFNSWGCIEEIEN